ncbi:MAG: aspartate aminotransferase family protein [Chloroflexi bacterium]|nr:aspartate aminotransferase family protein [Chloroflexota bacterium]MCH7653129.1 aspartate aminotransferase family protein [Chloroflexota bacterium]
MATIEERYEQKFAKSVEWYERGKSLFAGGVTHQTRFSSPFPTYFEHAEGPYKYDVDGNQIIDYVMGNGSLLMGHSPEKVVEAVKAQTSRGTHLGGASTHEVLYAEAVKSLMPSLERIRFTSSGTESTYLALRLARAYTGKTKIVKFHEHFHGWHDYVTPESGQSLGGVPKAVLDSVIVSPVDIAALDRILTEDNDVAAVIVECNGAHYGTFPLQNPQFLHDLRELTTRHGVVFIMDEVITGFRLSPGGAQVRWDLQPDLTTMAKIIAGGQPGSAVGGKAEIMELMAFSDDPEWNNVLRVPQGGTYNAQPTTVAAGLATLDAIANEGVNARADAMAKRLKDGLNESFIKNEVTGHAHGIASIVHVNMGADCNCDRDLCTMPFADVYSTMPVEKTRALRRAMLVNEVDMMGGRAFLVSSAHDEQVIDRTIDAFSQSLKDLREESGVV